jgi:hypothetical protein
MKNKVTRSVFILLLLLGTGCNRIKDCGYSESTHMVYNEQTKECECTNWDYSDICPLSETQYNSISLVRKNFDYYVKSVSEYPYFAHKGDTILVWGFIVGNDVYHLYESPVIPIGGDGIPCLDITGFNLSNNVDAYDTVYVTGVLEFPTLSNEKIKRKQSDQCFLVDYVLRIIEIHL